MPTLRFVLGDQLSRSVSSLKDADPSADIVLMAEVEEETRYVRHHKQKIAFLFAAMRHFAADLEGEGFAVDYRRLDEASPARSFTDALMDAIARRRPDKIIVTEPGEWRVLEMMRAWEATLGVPVEIRSDGRFFCSIDEFRRWSTGRQRLLMEHFYREMRRRTGLLMDEGDPVGGQWNFDAENRKPWPRGLKAPAPRTFAIDAVTAEVIGFVKKRFADHFGDLADFGWAVTRADALSALDAFTADTLAGFGDHQDAMQAGEAFLFHSVLSPYLNAGLLLPREVVAAAVRAYEEGRAPLNAVEGFVRQILGWREYVRGVYWTRMPDYAQSNALQAGRPLPWFYWSGETDMACVRDVVETTRRYAYAHHIQRLMVTGNLALLWGVSPAEIEEWYLCVYADAYDWVELPNTHGMAIFADGGLLASKPYAAGGAYINRMSNYCKSCRFDPKVRAGDDACPFTTLYWDFLMRHGDKLRGNNRMALPYKNLDAMPETERAAIAARASDVLEGRTQV